MVKQNQSSVNGILYLTWYFRLKMTPNHCGSQTSCSDVGSPANSTLAGSLASDSNCGSQVNCETGSLASDSNCGSQVNCETGSLASCTVGGSQATRKRPQECKICSNKEIMGYSTKDVYHMHFSNKVLRDNAAEKASDGLISCPTCKKDHVAESDCQSRLKICISSSTLHKFWQPKDSALTYEGDISHIDWMTIPGARINQLTQAWEILYIDEKRPMDVLLVGGLNNVIKGSDGQSIMNGLKHFVDLVTWQGTRYHPETPNTCAIATLPYPPCLCWLDDDGPVPEGFHNHIRNVKWLNYRIEELNASSGVKVPKFHTFGIRKFTRHGKSTTRHRLEHWREERRADKLHLTDKERMKMGRQVNKYFLHETES